MIEKREREGERAVITKDRNRPTQSQGNYRAAVTSLGEMALPHKARYTAQSLCRDVDFLLHNTISFLLSFLHIFTFYMLQVLWQFVP